MSPDSFVLSNLHKTGRLQFFYHSPLSRLPVRDLLGTLRHGSKLEPHIEKRAENYCAKCYQHNILGFVKSREKYLFLFTTCKSGDLGMEKFTNKRFIVGYIVKKRALPRRKPKSWAVQGPTRLYTFEDAYPLDELTNHPQSIRVMKLAAVQTAKVLDHFRGRKNILSQCLRELDRARYFRTGRSSSSRFPTDSLSTRGRTETPRESTTGT